MFDSAFVCKRNRSQLTIVFDKSKRLLELLLQRCIFMLNTAADQDWSGKWKGTEQGFIDGSLIRTSFSFWRYRWEDRRNADRRCHNVPHVSSPINSSSKSTKVRRRKPSCQSCQRLQVQLVDWSLPLCVQPRQPCNNPSKRHLRSESTRGIQMSEFC